MVIALPWTKSGQRAGSQEMVIVDDFGVIKLVWLYVSQMQPSDKHFRQTPANFRKCFDLLLKELHLSQHNFRPYSLRRGGATAHLQRTQNLEVILMMGRWSSLRTAKLYLTEGLAIAAQLAFSDSQRERFRSLSSDLLALVER